MAETCTGCLSCDCALCIERPENEIDSDEGYNEQKQREKLKKEQAKAERRAQRKRQRGRDTREPYTPPATSAAPATPPTAAAAEDNFFICDPPPIPHAVIDAKKAAAAKRQSSSGGASSSNYGKREQNPYRHQVTVAVTYEEDKDDRRLKAEAWVATEKYDGIRAVWVTNEPGAPYFRGRSGTPINAAPESLVALLPTDMVLDGELWAGRGNFEAIGSLMGSKSLEDGRFWEAAWGSLTYVVFDAPLVGTQYNYLERLEMARERLAPIASERVRVVTALPCASAKDKEALLDRVTGKGGEGLVLRRVEARWRCGSEGRNLLKVKEWFDAEAEVLSSLPAREARKLPTVHCRAINIGLRGGTFDLSVPRDRAVPAVGTIVTFGYKDVSRDSGLSAGGRATLKRLEKVHDPDCDCDVCIAR